MAYELFWISGSHYAWRVMLALEYKGIPYVSHHLNPSRGEHKSPTYLALNPRGKVPTLRDGETVVTESLAIMAYLESASPRMPLFGRTPAETGLIWQRISEFTSYTQGPIEQGIVFPYKEGGSVMDLERSRAAAAVALRQLAWMEQALSRTAFLAGDEVTAADMVALPTMGMLAQLGRRPRAQEIGLGFEQFSHSLPSIAAWMQRAEQIPGYDAAYPPSWRA
ncbi:glutathione S-transferase family protein [Sphingomonas glacialis]|uniref:Glutathione S-transferase family protein n=1 Tax=Sphingomonas glacialis TaxID=658225 RepID=A0A502FRM7_9SPHN|nr:glutathione S-transferase family protein [Sphingomonas glacialis]TPG52061.1 glutathione S-transferase family protein [Sphingomonas glacialis]